MQPRSPRDLAPAPQMLGFTPCFRRGTPSGVPCRQFLWNCHPERSRPCRPRSGRRREGESRDLGFSFFERRVFSCRYTAFTIALTKPGMVYSFASTCALRPSSRNVADVTGPMDASFTPARFLRPSIATKFLAVDELVNVM